MAKQKNPNIGKIKCLEGCGTVAAVRKDRNGKFYTDCPTCGRLPAGHAPRQDRIASGAVIWGEQGTPPSDCPKWIAESWPWTMALRDPEGVKSIGGGSEESPAAPQGGPVKSSQGIKPLPAAPRPKETPQAAPEAAPEESPEPAPTTGGFSFLGDM